MDRPSVQTMHHNNCLGFALASEVLARRKGGACKCPLRLQWCDNVHSFIYTLYQLQACSADCGCSCFSNKKKYLCYLDSIPNTRLLLMKTLLLMGNKIRWNKNWFFNWNCTLEFHNSFLVFSNQFFHLYFHFSAFWSLYLPQTLLQWLYFEFILSKLDENKAYILSEKKAL